MIRQNMSANKNGVRKKVCLPPRSVPLPSRKGIGREDPFFLRRVASLLGWRLVRENKDDATCRNVCERGGD